MKDAIHYKGYVGSVSFSQEDELFHGRVEGVRALLSFEGRSATELIGDFRDTIDEYLAYCAGRGQEPERPYKGSFNVRVGPEVHRRAAETAARRGMSLNAFVENAIRRNIEKEAV